MAWTTPRTWVAAEVVSAALLNTHIRDNLNYLLSGRVVAKSTYVGIADKTTTSATFGDADATNLIISLTPQSTRVLVIFQFAANPATTVGEFDIVSTTLGTRAGDTTHGLTFVQLNQQNTVTLVGYFSGLTAGVSQSFKVQFRSVTATNTTKIFSNGVPISMFAMEV